MASLDSKLLIAFTCIIVSSLSLIHISGFWICHPRQTLFDVQLLSIINFQEYLLNYLPLCHNRDIQFSILNFTIIVKPKSFLVCVYLIHMYRFIKFHLLGYYKITHKTLCSSKCTTTLGVI